MKCKECKKEIGDAIHIRRKNGDRVCLNCMPFVNPIPVTFKTRDLPKWKPKAIIGRND